MSFSINALMDQAAQYNVSLPEHQPEPELPKFAFSPRHTYLSRAALCAACDMRIHEKPGERNHIYFGDNGPFCPVCATKKEMADLGRSSITYHHGEPAAPLQIIGKIGAACPVKLAKARKPGKKRQLPAVEEGWLNLQPFFKAEVKPGLRQPMGTTKPLEGLERFLDRWAEIQAIAKTQYQELPTLAQEFAANGLSAVSLSSSPSDDDLDAANIAEHHLRRTPYDPDPETLAALVSRIDWEKFVLGCSSSTKIYAKVREDGKLVLGCDNKTWTADQIAAYAPKIKALLEGRDAATLTNDRERARHYGAPVLASMSPNDRRSFKYRMYTDFADDNQSRLPFYDNETPSTGGPQEIGFHDPIQPTEPTEFDLWPMTDQEAWFGIETFETFLNEREQEAASAWSV